MADFSSIPVHFNSTPELSIIVPTLNEAVELPELFASLAAQRKISFELILCDGGSDDDSCAIAQHYAATAPFTVQCLTTVAGRGRQMNHGAAAANSDLLLFLHADSRFASGDALATALAFYRQNSSQATGTGAARFRLHFRRESDLPSLAYHYYEQKAQLDRSDCIRGDQGLLIRKDYFHRLGWFDTSLPFLEDLRLAEKITKSGRWLLIPADISTSARRFEHEGLYERQALNAIITCCHTLKWDQFFTSLPDIYRRHGNGSINFGETVRGICRLIAEQPCEWQHLFWKNAGQYVATNAWQIFFWLDVRRSFYQKVTTATVPHLLLWYQRKAARFFDSPPVGYCAMILTRLWIQYHCRR